ncbi:MAG: hypothetical protein ACXWPM_02870 [Bdellovibrionota bacterium]
MAVTAARKMLRESVIPNTERRPPRFEILFKGRSEVQDAFVDAANNGFIDEACSENSDAEHENVLHRRLPALIARETPYGAQKSAKYFTPKKSPHWTYPLAHDLKPMLFGRDLIHLVAELSDLSLKRGLER